VNKIAPSAAQLANCILFQSCVSTNKFFI